MNTAFNTLFTVYVALFSLSLLAFIQCMLSFDLAGPWARFMPEYSGLGFRSSK